MSLEAIDKALSRMPLRSALFALSELCRLAQHSQNKDYPVQAAIAARVLPARSAATARRILHGGNATVLMPQVVLNLAIRALVVCPYDDREADPGDLDKALGPLLMAMGGHLGSDREVDGSFTVELLRLSLLANRQVDSIWVELGAELFFDILPTLEHPQFVDADEVIRAKYGISLHRLWALTAVQGAALSTDSGMAVVPTRMKEWNASDEDLAAWSRAWTQSVTDARAAAAVDIRRGTGWSFSCCTDRPLVELDPGRSIALLPSGLFTQATLPRMFWAVRQPWVAKGGDHEQWSGFFGAGIEQLGRNLAERALPGAETITEADLENAGSPSQCDLIVADEKSVAIDFVYRQFTLPTVATGNREHLAEDLRDAVIGKAGQIDRALSFATERLSFSPRTVIPLVVVGGPFPLTQRLYDEIDALLPHDTFAFVGKDSRCRPLAVMDMANFSLALTEAKVSDRTLGEVLIAWQESEWRHHNFREWWIPFGSPRAEPTNSWPSRAYTELGLPGPPP